MLDAYVQDDLDIIWKDVRNKVADMAGSLPHGTIGPFVNDDFGDVTVVSAAITGEGFSMAEVHRVAKHVADAIYLVQGVKRVDLYGVQEETIWIEFSTARIGQLGFSVESISSALVSQNIVLPGGSIDTGKREIIVVPRAACKRRRGHRERRARDPGSQQVIRLGDIASVRRAYVDPPADALLLRRRAGGPARCLDGRGRERPRPGPAGRGAPGHDREMLPIGFQIRIGNYQPTHVERAVAGVRSNLMQTILIVLVVIVAFLGVRTGRDRRAARAAHHDRDARDHVHDGHRPASHLARDAHHLVGSARRQRHRGGGGDRQAALPGRGPRRGRHRQGSHSRRPCSRRR